MALDAQRPRRVPLASAEALQAEGWIIAPRKRQVWMLVRPAAPQTRKEYGDVLAASLDYAVRQGWLDANSLDQVKRAGKRLERARILRRDDFYDPDEVDLLLRYVPSVFEEAFLLRGAHAGFRLPGQALGLHWGRGLPGRCDPPIRELGARRDGYDEDLRL